MGACEYLPAPPSMVTVQSLAILVPPMGFMLEDLNCDSSANSSSANTLPSSPSCIVMYIYMLRFGSSSSSSNNSPSVSLCCEERHPYMQRSCALVAWYSRMGTMHERSSKSDVLLAAKQAEGRVHVTTHGKPRSSPRSTAQATSMAIWACRQHAVHVRIRQESNRRTVRHVACTTTRTHTHAHRRKCAQMRIYTHTCADTDTRTDRQTDHTHRHTHTHMHTPSPASQHERT